MDRDPRRLPSTIFGAFVLLASVMRTPHAHAAPLPRAAAVRIDQVVDAFIAEGWAPGVSVAVMRDGELVFSKSYGLANLETLSPVESQTVFRAGSVTKQFTAAAIMVLAQEGRLSVDDPLSKYVPELAKAGPITLRMLLTHTSGLHTYTDEAFANEDRLAHTSQQMVDYIAAQKLLIDFAPGSRWAYSNSNFYLLGVVVERVSGRPLNEFLSDTIFSRAGLTTAALDHEDDVVLHRASGYVAVPDHPGQYRNAAFISMDPPGGAGALRSTANDLARWHQAFFANRVLNASSVTAMTTPGRLASGAIAIRNDSPVSQTPPTYGFGLELGPFEGEPTVGHGGAVPGFTDYLVTFPRLKATVVIMTNGEPNAHEPFADIERAVLDAFR